MNERIQNALLSRRENCNSLFVSYRSRQPSLDESEFKELLFSLLNVLETVPAELEASLPDLSEEIFRVTLDLISSGFNRTAAKFPEFGNAFQRLLNQPPSFFFESPGKFIRMLYVALRHLVEAGVNARDWAEIVLRASAECRNEESYQKIGFVSAWISGMAHFRNRALEVSESLTPAAFQLLFQTSDDQKTQIENMRANPWWKPSSDNSSEKLRFRKSGGFSGFGGVLLNQPELLTAPDGMFVKDGKKTFRIYADAFGVKLIPLEPDSTMQDVSSDANEFSVSGTSLRFQNRKAEIPELQYLEQFTQDRRTFYFTISNSFYVFIGGVG